MAHRSLQPNPSKALSVSGLHECTDIDIFVDTRLQVVSRARRVVANHIRSVLAYLDASNLPHKVGQMVYAKARRVSP